MEMEEKLELSNRILNDLETLVNNSENDEKRIYKEVYEKALDLFTMNRFDENGNAY